MNAPYIEIKQADNKDIIKSFKDDLSAQEYANKVNGMISWERMADGSKKWWVFPKGVTQVDMPMTEE